MLPDFVDVFGGETVELGQVCFGLLDKVGDLEDVVGVELSDDIYGEGYIFQFVGDAALQLGGELAEIHLRLGLIAAHLVYLRLQPLVFCTQPFYLSSL